MEEKKRVCCIKQDFQIEVRFESRGLLIQITSLVTGTVYSATYFSDNLADDVKELIDDIEELYEHIQNKINEKDIITVTPQGHLKIIAMKTSLTNKQKPKIIILPTQEMKVDKFQQISKMNNLLIRQMTDLKNDHKMLKLVIENLQQKSKIKSRFIDNQDQTIKENSLKIYDLQRKVSRINKCSMLMFFIIIAIGVIVSKNMKLKPIDENKRSDENDQTKQDQIKPNILKIKPQFDSKIAPHFSFNETTGEITKTKDGQEQIVSIQHLPNTGKYYFQIKILSSKKQRQSIGIVTIDARETSTTLYNTNSIKYSAFNGYIFQNKSFSKAGSPIHVGSIVKVEVDMNDKIISWYVNNDKIASTSIPDRFVEKAIYASIQVYNQSDRILVV